MAGGDDQDVLDAGLDGLLDHVLDHRAVDDREHLLGHSLGEGEEASTKTGGGDDRLAYLRHGGDPTKIESRNG